MNEIRSAADVVIVGAGHAGAQLGIQLRQLGFPGSIVMISREVELPYERPPLSKEYLAGEKAFERLYIRPSEFWRDKDIDLRLGERVREVDPVGHHVVLSSGKRINYGHLVWAAGGEPRRLTCEGAGLSGIHYVRDKVDVDQLKLELQAGARRVVVIGGGYIGLEAASVFNILGLNVTLLEAMPRVLGRVAGPDLSEFYQKEHRSRGVDLRTDVQVASIIDRNGRVGGVRLTTGEEIGADIVIAGIGIIPTVAPLAAAGAVVTNGVEVDSYCRTNLPEIFAIGDCALQANSFADGAKIRVESVQNATDMAKTVAQALCGHPQPHHAVPWFWSNQYDLRLQTVGLSNGYDATVLRGDPTLRSFTVVYLKGGAVIALDCVNMVKDYVQGKTLVVDRRRVDPANLGNVAMPLKDIASPAR